MRTLVTLAWSVTVEMSGDFDEDNNEHLQRAIDAAWPNVQKKDAVVVDQETVDVDPSPFLEESENE